MTTRLSLTTISLAAILVLATFLRLIGIGEESLWGDETHTAVTIRESWWTLLWEPIDNNQPLHFLLLKAWTALAGTSEAALRFPSAVFGVLAVGATFFLGKRVSNEWVGIGAALLVAVAPVMIWYSQETRTYAMQTFFAVAALYFLVRHLDERDDRMLAGFVAMSALGLFTHFYFAIYIGGFFIGAMMWLLPHGRYSDAAKLLAANALVALTLLPRVPVILEYARTDYGGAYTEPPSVLLRRDLFKYPGFAIPRITGSTVIPLLGAAIWGLAGFSGVIGFIRAGLGHRPATLMVLVAAVTSSVILIAAGWLLDLPIVGRYLVPSLPLWFILAMDGLALILPWTVLLHRRVLVPAALVLAVVGLSLGLFKWTEHREIVTREDWRGMAEFIEANGEDGDAVVANSTLSRRSYSYYQEPEDRPATVWQVETWPCENGENMWLIARVNATGDAERIEELEEICSLDAERQFPFNWGALRFTPRGATAGPTPD